MVVLENRWIHIEIDSWYGAFIEILNRPLNLHLLTKGFKSVSPPWILFFQEDPQEAPRQTTSFENCNLTVSKDGRSVNFLWKVRQGLNIRATATIKDSPELILMCSVENNTRGVVAGIEFPVIYGIGTLGGEPDDTYLAHPVAGGFLFRAPFRTFYHTPYLRHTPYPSGFASPMQFFAYYLKDRGGFWFACYDSKNTAKEFNFFRDEKALVASILHESWDLKQGNSLELTYPVIIGALEEGDWRAAAQHYRNWATGKEKNSPDWCSLGTLEQRVKKGKTARWLIEEVGFCTFGMPASIDVSKWINAFHKIADIPVFHILGYDWAKWADIENPQKSELEKEEPAEWFPAKFHPENLKAIKQNGDYFAPFLYDFFSYGHNLDMYGLLSPQLREKTNNFMSRWMHPATKFWQDFHTRRDAEVVKEYGADANYYDISASVAGNFSDRTDLGCPAGKGRHLIDAYHKIYQLSRNATEKVAHRYIPRGTQTMIENFIGVVDFCHCAAGGEVQGDMEGKQFVEWQKEGIATRIPLWSCVYHEFGPVRLDGWCKLSKEFGDYFYYIASRICLEGSLLELNYEFSSLEMFKGMTGPSMHLSYECKIIVEQNPFEADPEKIEFLREISIARTQFAKKYLAYGKMACPLKFIPEVEFVELDWYHYNDIEGRRENGVQKVPAVIHEAWVYKDKMLGALFVNLLRKPQTIIAIIDTSRYGILKGPWKLYLATRDKKPVFLGELSEPVGKVRFSLEPRKIYLLEILGSGIDFSFINKKGF